MPNIAAAVPLAGSLISGFLGSSSADKASKRQRRSFQEALAEDIRRFEIARELAQPGIEAGNTARDALLRLLGLAEGGEPIDLSGIPGFDFQIEQGTRALNAIRSTGARSGGATIKDFARFNQGTASDFYRDYANRLANLAGTGQTAALQAGNQAIGSSPANLIVGAGNARASGVLGRNAAFQTAIEDIFGSLPELFPDIFGGGRSTDISPEAAAAIGAGVS